MTEKPAQRRPRERTLFLIAAAVFSAAVVWLLIALVSGATLVNLRGLAGAAMIGVVACAVARAALPGRLPAPDARRAASASCSSPAG